VIAFIHIIILSGIFFWVRKKFPQPIFSLALFFKIVAGIGLGLLYQNYYATGDTWTFFTDATHAADMLRQHPERFIDFFWFDDWSSVGFPLGSSGLKPLFMVKWVTLFNLITGNNYWLTATYFSILSCMATWMLYHSVVQIFPSVRYDAACAILFMPSVVFWGSGVIKESLSLGALFCLTAVFLNWYQQRKISVWGFVGMLISFWLLWNLKYYWLAVWLSVTLPLVLVNRLSNQWTWITMHKSLVWFLLLLASIIVISFVHPNFSYNRILSVIVDNYEAYIRISEPADVIEYHNLKPTILSVILNAPWALMSSFFRPFIWEAGTVFQLLASLETSMLLALFAMALFRWKRWWPHVNELHVAIIFYTMLLGILLALATPNFGSLSRYRIGFTPFLWLLLLRASNIFERLLSLK
jgi:hypothetical protein